MEAEAVRESIKRLFQKTLGMCSKIVNQGLVPTLRGGY